MRKSYKLHLFFSLLIFLLLSNCGNKSNLESNDNQEDFIQSQIDIYDEDEDDTLVKKNKDEIPCDQSVSSKHDLPKDKIKKNTEHNICSKPTSQSVLDNQEKSETYEVREFIKHLYSSNILFKKKFNCFTEGTFIFEDNHGKLFDLIVGKCKKTRGFGSELISSKYKEGAINSMAIKPFHASKLCKNPYIYGTYDIDKNSWFTKRMNGELLQLKKYEYEFGSPLEFLCDLQCNSASNKSDTNPCSNKPKSDTNPCSNKPKCNTNPCSNKPKCNTNPCSDDKRKDPKRALMFFRFKTKSQSKCNLTPKKDCEIYQRQSIFQERKKKNKVRTYVLVQLASNRTVSLKYLGYNINKEIKKAFNLFKFKSFYPPRRRDGKLTIILGEEKSRLLSNIKNDEKKFKAAKSIDFYNKNIRLGNEMFIPQGITNILFKTFHKKNI